MTTRRTFLTTSAVAATAALGTPWRLSAMGWPDLDALESPRRDRPLDDPDLQVLARRALDAATAAGASYADIRFTRTQRRHFPTLEEQYGVAVGLRALVQGQWGFLATTELTAERMEWLGQTAGRLAKASAWPNVPPITLGERPPVATGHWETPVERDPWTVPTAEIRELMEQLGSASFALKGQATLKFNIHRQERTFASTDGAFTTQTLHTMFGPGGEGSSFSVAAAGLGGIVRRGTLVRVPSVSPCSGGFEVVTQQRFLERLPEWMQIAQRAAESDLLEAPGRFDVVFDGYAMAALVRALGTALEVDRAVGNSSAGRTSYLAPVETVIGTSPFPTAVTLTGNRTMPGGAATVRWDDEGVAAQTFPLIHAGQLVDYATSREFVPELTAGYRARGQTAQSRGCAGSTSALAVPVVQTPNLELAPSANDVSFEEMVSGLEDGFVITGGDLQADAQQLNVLGGQDAFVYRVKQGKFVNAIQDVRYTARMPELWKTLVALGGARSAVTRGFAAGKGGPDPSTHTVRAVAARFKNVFIRISGE